jgi:hypothetical protein
MALQMALLLLVILLFLLWCLESQKDVVEGFSFSEMFPSMTYVLYTTFMFGLFGQLYWIAFLF